MVAVVVVHGGRVVANGPARDAGSAFLIGQWSCSMGKVVYREYGGWPICDQAETST